MMMTPFPSVCVCVCLCVDGKELKNESIIITLDYLPVSLSLALALSRFPWLLFAIDSFGSETEQQIHLLLAAFVVTLI